MKVLKCCANIYINKQCLYSRIIPSYIFLASCKRFFNSGFYLSHILLVICTNYGIPHCTHIEGN